MTTLDATADPDRCQSCGARATSCDIRVWLSGRSCCPSCQHATEEVTA